MSTSKQAKPRSVPGAAPPTLRGVAELQNLRRAWGRVAEARGHGTPGIDGLACHDVLPRLAGWLGRLSAELAAGRYRPDRALRVALPKKSGGEREISILTVRDRVVQAAIKQALEPVFEPRFDPDSFGFRPRRSNGRALRRAVDLLNDGCLHAVRTDVKDCFPTLDHGVILAELERRIGDEPLLRLLRRLIAKQAAREAGDAPPWWALVRRWRAGSEEAVPHGLWQGGCLSPLLCNVALDRVDRALRAEGAGHALRYADDLLLLGRSRRDARRLSTAATAAVAEGRQALRRTAVPAGRPFEWLGMRLEPPAPGKGGGWRILIPDAQVRAIRGSLDELLRPPGRAMRPEAFDAAMWIASINDRLDQWRSSYAAADNAAAVFAEIDVATHAAMPALLGRLLDRRGRSLRAAHCRGGRWSCGGVTLRALGRRAA